MVSYINLNGEFVIFMNNVWLNHGTFTVVRNIINIIVLAVGDTQSLSWSRDDQDTILGQGRAQFVHSHSWRNAESLLKFSVLLTSMNCQNISFSFDKKFLKIKERCLYISLISFSCQSPPVCNPPHSLQFQTCLLTLVLIEVNDLHL